MSPKTNSNSITGFFAELIRRRVLHIGGAYVAGAWLGAEILNFLFEQFNAPGWAYRLLAIVLVVGFPISMILAWTIQMQEDGSWAFDPSKGDQKAVAAAVVLAILITAGLSWVILPQREPEPTYEPLPRSLAVLPFITTGGTQNERAAAGTLYRSLMEGLEQSQELTLVRLGPGEPPEDLRVFGKSLGVAALASGRIVPSVNGASVEVQLLDVVLGEQTWSASWAWESSRIIEIAGEIANGLLEAIALPVLEQERFTGTDNRAAYEAFMRGEENVAAWTADSLSAAVEDFQRAIDADPGYTQAYVGLAQSLYDLVERAGITGPERSAMEKRARRAVEIAQRLNPESADALSLLGLSQSNRQMRIVAFERALELDPDHYMSYYRYAQQMKADGDLEEAERLIRRAISLKPMSARFRIDLAEILTLQGRGREAQSELEKAAAFQD